MRTKITTTTLVVGAALALGSPLVTASAAVPVAAPAPGSVAGSSPSTAYVETQLFFGTARPDGGPAVTARQFQDFLDRQVTPRFPAGLTVQEGHGQYRDRFGVIESERSYEVILLYPASAAPSADPKIEQIRSRYNEQFAQESVARVDQDARVDF
ncbi:DUF3574 domain-containing protein [Streptomyces sp. NPDC048057]|uniref:DUF3574 domain-containing protein n=1 Tax=Streptomyces sp. NPDC048057 TaxID=3155628 RepID=UPI0033D5CD77